MEIMQNRYTQTCRGRQGARARQTSTERNRKPLFSAKAAALLLIAGMMIQAAWMAPGSGPVEPAAAEFTALTPSVQVDDETPEAPVDTVQPTGHIVFPAYDPNKKTWDLHITGADGTGRALLWEYASQPSYSPAGDQLAFRSEHPSHLGLAALDMNTRELRQLTRFAEDARAKWSREIASLLIFSSQRQPDRRWRLYGLIADVPLDWEYAVNNKPIYGDFPAWLPDNRMVYAGCVQGQCGLILADGDGSNPRALTTNPDDKAPAVSPDGEWIAYMSQNEGNWDLYLIRVDNGTPVPLTATPGNEGPPEWSPDGNYIGFVSNQDGELAIWTVAFDPVDGKVSEPSKLIDLTDVPPEGWPWLEGHIAWGS